MKKFRRHIYIPTFLGFLSLGLIIGCEREEFDLEPAKYPNTAEVFIDGFSAGLEYAAFGDSKLTAFDVDQNVFYEGTASMRFDVPNEGDGYAGGVFRDLGGRDLTGYDALTFWVKASQSSSIDLLGFGQDFGGNEHSTTITSLELTSSWTKYTIPIPDPAKLVREKGMFVFADGPDEGKGYSVWFDEVKFEKLGTLAHPRPAIMGGEDVSQVSFEGITTSLTGLSQTFNLASGMNQTVIAAPGYFDFSSSNTSVATIDEAGVITIGGSGTTIITATIGGQTAKGSLSIESLGDFIPAPTPTQAAADVISIFSDAYENIPVDFYNGYFAPFQTTLGQNDITIEGDNIIKYTDLNFVATEFKNPTIDVTRMTHFHADILVDELIDPGDFIRIQLGDFGPDNAFEGGDDSDGSVIISSAGLTRGSWISLDLPLVNFSGLTSRSNLAQIFFVSDATISSLYVDNMYFYEGDPVIVIEPTTAAPTPPARDAADVISIFSDAYTDISGIDRYPDWDQSTQVSEVTIAGNNTLKYTNFNYQGTDFSGNAQDVSGMEFLHVDMWTANATNVKVTPINASGSPIESLQGLTPVTSEEWVSYDIPLSDFTASGMTLNQIIQLKFDGQSGASPSNIWLDNIYFYKVP